MFPTELADVDDHPELVSKLFIASVEAGFVSAKHTHCFELNGLHRE